MRATASCADQQRGRFRDYLLTLVKRFAYDRTVRPRQQEQFEHKFVSIHSLVQDSDRAYEPPAHETPEEAFQKKWQAEVQAAVRRNLQAYYEGSAKAQQRRQFEIFVAARLAGPAQKEPTQDELADHFQVSRDQVRYALRIVGKHAERLLRQELRDQLGSEGDIDKESEGML